MPKLKINKSKIKGAGNGLFTKKLFRKGEVVCKYHGDKMKKMDTYKLFMTEKDKYIKDIHPYARDLDDIYVIIGKKSKPLFDCGVYVNDSWKLRGLTPSSLREYAKKSKMNQNVDIKIKDGELFYVATKRIKKGEELYASYGLGYWLLSLGVEPQKIADMNSKFPFDKY